MNKDQLEFFIFNDGDASVGINSSQFKVTVEGLNQLDNAFLENFIEYFKEDLKEYFDLETRCTVYTKKELDKYTDGEYSLATWSNINK